MSVGGLEQRAISCPYCGESIQVLIDPEEAGQAYIEDCQVCCRPITIKVVIDAGGYLSILAQDENEAW